MMGRKMVKSHQRACIKDTWTKSKGGYNREWEVGMPGVGVELLGGKWREFYLNNNT